MAKKLSPKAARNLVIGGVACVAILLIAWMAGVPDSVLAPAVAIMAIAVIALSAMFGESDP